MTKLETRLQSELSSLADRGLLRSPIDVPDDALVLCSNDYLGYGLEPLSSLDVGDAASGAGASRLISGDRSEHRAAEGAIADWLGVEDALLMSSGYAANVGVLSALAGADDVIISDALNHASIIDGCRLSRSKVIVTDHADYEAVHRALETSRGARRRWIVTESYFSMDGHVADLLRLRELADAHDACLIVDEAHALGVFGEEGSGGCRVAGVHADVIVGTLGKALGLAGAFVAGSSSLRAMLWNSARSFVFSTAVPPWLAAAAQQRVARARADDAARARLTQIVDQFRAALERMNAPIAASKGPIVPWIIGEAGEVMRKRDALLADGVFVQAIRPPTVPVGTSRLRITLHAKLSDHEIGRALRALAAHCASPLESKPQPRDRTS